MSLTINTNIASLTAQNNLNTSQSMLNNAIQQLSSGLRINSAADDAAGYAIAQRMTAQINGMSTASNNANNGISLVQTALGALTSVTNNLQSIRQLAVEAANGTNSSGDLANINTQAQQLMSEINRVASQTQFNGVNLLDGSFANQQLQVGANAGQVINIGSISSVKAAALGTWTSNAVAGIAPTATTAITAGDLTVNGVSVGAVAAGATVAAQAANVAAAINSVSDQTGVTATVAAGAVSLSSVGSTNITVGVSGTATTADTGLTAGAGTQTVNSGFGNLSLSTAQGATDAIAMMDGALNAVNSQAASLGALQNRLQSAVSNLATSEQNMQSAHSTITDANFAQATAQMTKAQILQQAGVSVLAQANSAPQAVLKLLQ